MIRRPSLLVALALLATPVGEAVPLRADRTLSLHRAGTTALRLPAAPWSSLHRIALGATTAHAPAVLPDGTLAVLLDAPPRVAFVDSRGDSVRTVPLPARATRTASVGADGRLLVTLGRAVHTLAPDGTARALAELNDHPDASPWVRADGSSVVLTTPNDRTVQLATLTPRGDLATAVMLPGQQYTASAHALLDDALLVATSTRVIRIDRDDRITSVPSPGVVTTITARRAGFAMTVAGALLFADASGVVRARHALPGDAVWTVTLPDDRVVALCRIANAPSRVVYATPAALHESAALLPPDASAGLVDATGALLVPSRRGEVVALDGDGAERWRLSIHDTLRGDVVALPRGGVALATAGDDLLVLDDVP